jgi:hypothetical protein
MSGEDWRAGNAEVSTSSAQHKARPLTLVSSSSTHQRTIKDLLGPQSWTPTRVGHSVFGSFHLIEIDYSECIFGEAFSTWL